MSRRAVGFLVGVIVVILLTATNQTVTPPYVAVIPGPALNTLGSFDGQPVIHVEARRTYPDAGRL